MTQSSPLSTGLHTVLAEYLETALLLEVFDAFAAKTKHSSSMKARTVLLALDLNGIDDILC